MKTAAEKKAVKAAYNKRYREEHRDKLAAYMKAYYEKRARPIRTSEQKARRAELDRTDEGRVRTRAAAARYSAKPSGKTKRADCRVAALLPLASSTLWIMWCR